MLCGADGNTARDSSSLRETALRWPALSSPQDRPRSGRRRHLMRRQRLAVPDRRGARLAKQCAGCAPVPIQARLSRARRAFEVNARTTLSRSLAVVLSVALSQALAPVAFAAGSHLVETHEVGARLAEEAAARQARVALVQSVLDGPRARQQAGVMGLQAERLRAAVPHLSDAELADLGQRAEQVKDVAAGYHDDGLAIVGLVLLLAGLAVLVAVSDSGDNYDDCYCY
jgi:hypothetical protein